MNQYSDNSVSGDDTDPLVSAEYRTAATERTPPALDAAVLKTAAAAATDTGLTGFMAGWFRPLAFVATLSLSLALLLELSQAPTEQSVIIPEVEFGRRKAESIVTYPAAATTGETSSADLPTEKNQLQAVNIDGASAPAAANAPLADEQNSADFALMIEESAKQMQAEDSVTANAIRGLEQNRAADKIETGIVDGLRASAYSPDEAPRPCTREQLAVPESWWRCISDLEKVGRHDEAKAELELFKKAHPDFEAAEIVTSP